MWKALLVVAMACFVTTAHAQQCQPTNAEKFIADGMAAIANGTVQGDVLRGTQAATFGKDIGITSEVLAVFLVKSGADSLLLILVRTPDGTEMVCYGPASLAAKQSIDRLLGKRA